MNESSHWYSREGLPCYTQPKKDGSGDRKTTLADARKFGLLPSVTTVLQVLAKPALNKWFVRNGAMAAITTPRNPGEADDAFLERVLAVDAEDISEKAKDLGSDIHGAIEAACSGQPYDGFEAYVAPVLTTLLPLGKVVSSERIVVHPLGFAGKLDCLLESECITVLDFKSCNRLPKEPYVDHWIQVATYAASIGNTGNRRIQTAVLYISTSAPGEVRLFIEADWMPHFEVFKHLFAVWCHLNSYTP